MFSAAVAGIAPGRATAGLKPVVAELKPTAAELQPAAADLN